MRITEDITHIKLEVCFHYRDLEEAIEWNEKLIADCRIRLPKRPGISQQAI